MKIRMGASLNYAILKGSPNEVLNAVLESGVISLELYHERSDGQRLEISFVPHQT